MRIYGPTFLQDKNCVTGSGIRGAHVMQGKGVHQLAPLFQIPNTGIGRNWTG